MFVDDRVIFTEVEREAYGIQFDVRTADPHGLTINTDKTKIFINEDFQAIIHFNGVQIEQAEQFQYLSSFVQEWKARYDTSGK